MVETLKLDATLTTSFGKVMDFARAICERWSPAFLLSINRDGMKGFGRDRFDKWVIENMKDINWNVLYPEDRCNARLKSGKNKGMRCSKKSRFLDVEQTFEGNVFVSKEDTGFCSIHSNTRSKYTASNSNEVDNYTKNNLVYCGEPPTKLRSLVKDRVNKRILQAPGVFFVEDDEVQEKNIMTLLHKVSKNVNYLINRDMKKENRLKFLEKKVNLLADPKQLSLEKSNLLDKKFETYKEMLYEANTDDEVLSDSSQSRLLMKNQLSNVTFESECLAHRPDLLEASLKSKKLKEDLSNKSFGVIMDRRIREQRTSDELLGKNISISGVSYPSYSFDDLRDNLPLEAVGTGILLSSTKIKSKEVVNTNSNLGKIKSTLNQSVGIYESLSSDITQGQQHDDDVKFKEEIKKYMKNNNLKLPIKDPSRDPISQEFADVIVRIRTVDGVKVEQTYQDFYDEAKTVIGLMKELGKNGEYTMDYPEDMKEMHERVYESASGKFFDFLLSNDIRPRNRARAIKMTEEIDNILEMIRLVIRKYHSVTKNDYYKC